MVNSSLNDYVRLQLQRGYPPEAVRMALMQAGYNPQDIDFALRVASKPVKRFEISGRNLAVLTGGILAIFLLIIAGFLVFRAEPKDIALSVRLDKPQYAVGETLGFSVTLSSEQERDVPVALEYQVYDPFTRKTLTSRSERLTVGRNAFTSQDVPLPRTLQPGEYEVKVTARFEGITRVQTERFTIPQPTIEVPEGVPVGEEETFEPAEIECPATCDDLNPVTEDKCERGSCVHIVKQGVCGNGECETGENRILCPEDCGASQDKDAVVQQALAASRTDAERAATLCNTLILPEDADLCFAAIANASSKSQLCLNIQDLRARDDCLMEFAFKNDYTVCTQLSNRYLLTSCQSLARFSTAQSEQAEAEALASQVEIEGATE